MLDPDAKLLLNAQEIDKRIHRLAYHILERHPRTPFCFVGIRRLGVPLAQRAAKILEMERPGIPIGSLDITLYRDDPDNLQAMLDLGRSRIDFEVTGALVILFDDVLFTGRTIRAAIEELMDFGRPAGIELAVLVDRGHRELPIQPDYPCYVHATEPDEYVRVLLREEDGQDGVYLSKRKSSTVT